MNITLRPWDESGFGVLLACNTPAMTEHLGGPESDEKLRDRQRRYLNFIAVGMDARPMIVDVDGEPAGSVGYWTVEDDEWEMSWAIAPPFQGRGVASAAVALALTEIATRGGSLIVHATPGIHNTASNAVARTAGFTLVKEYEIEYPVGHRMMANDWVYDLGKRESSAH